ncbi:hypothetical protein BgiMline_020818 [Biomphalaria glabrata]|nr:hypothetical protein BgiMline_017999 [Biomphalaria glabrata]
MGIRGFTKNSKKSFKAQKSFKWQRMCKAEKKKSLPKESIEIENIHLFSEEKLKNKLKNPKNNIKISGKKLRRLTKRLNHRLREKSQMETEIPETKAKTVTLRDVDMADREEEFNEPVSFSEPDTASTSVTASMPVKSSKKKKRSGKKNKTKPVESNPGKKEQLFDTEDGWEDVEMSEG